MSTLRAGCVYQDAREVQTKFSKTFTTYFFPVGADIRQIVDGWVTYLREEKLWGNDDPLFPATRVALGAARQFEAVGLERAHWSSAAPNPRDLPATPSSPRACRTSTLTASGTPSSGSDRPSARPPEQFKAWSQNLGHDRGSDDLPELRRRRAKRQGQIINALATDGAQTRATQKRWRRRSCRRCVVRECSPISGDGATGSPLKPGRMVGRPSVAGDHAVFGPEVREPFAPLMHHYADRHARDWGQVLDSLSAAPQA